MSGTIDALTGKAAEKAKKAAALAQAQTQVAQARQMAAEAAQSKDGLTRRNPRGRRLLADATASNLPGTIA